MQLDIIKHKKLGMEVFTAVIILSDRTVTSTFMHVGMAITWLEVESAKILKSL